MTKESEKQLCLALVEAYMALSDDIWLANQKKPPIVWDDEEIVLTPVSHEEILLKPKVT
jgi:hypothetical protein